MNDIFKDYKEKSCSDFQRLTGVNKGTFQILFSKYSEGVSAYLSEKPKRKCGVQVSLSPENQLLLCLLYLRAYHTLLELGTQFGISESYAQKRYVFTKSILLKCLQCPDIASLKTTVETNLIAVDVTEQPIERPVEGQEEYYSGKKKLHTIKVLLFVCLLTGLIKGIRFGIGKNHDFDIFKAEPTVLAEDLKIKADSGFQGIQKMYKNAEIPYKKSKNNPLDEQKKEFNKQLASQRVPIEHGNRSCKIFKICGSRFRGKHQNYEDTWLLVTAIVNLKISTTNLKYSDF